MIIVWRIRIEERALLTALNDRYRTYAAHHKRLIHSSGDQRGRTRSAARNATACSCATTRRFGRVRVPQIHPKVAVPM